MGWDDLELWELSDNVTLSPKKFLGNGREDVVSWRLNHVELGRLTPFTDGWSDWIFGGIDSRMFCRCVVVLLLVLTLLIMDLGVIEIFIRLLLLLSRLWLLSFIRGSRRRHHEWIDFNRPSRSRVWSEILVDSV